MSRIEAATKYCSAVEDRSTGSVSISAAIGGGSGRRSCSTFAGCASIRKSNVSWPRCEASRFRSTARKVAPFGEVGVRLADDRQIGERVEGLAVGAM